MARNAPTINGTPTYKEFSIRYLDDSGDVRSVLYKCDPAITDATIEAHVAAAADATSAVIHRVTVSEVYNAVEDATLAVDGEQNSVFDNLVLLFKTAAGASQNVFLPAPVEGVMDGDSDNIDTASALYTDFRDTAEACLLNAFEPVSVRYTERREINDNKKPA